MNRAIALKLAAAATISLACARSTPGIELRSSDFDLDPLVGQWRGNFISSQPGRSGTIAFTLRAGESAASGNVVLFQKPDSLLTAEERELMANVPDRTVLKIHFLRKEGGNVNGGLDPYHDPECDCTVTTNFQGGFTNATTIEGDYTTVRAKPGNDIIRGKWKVTRVKKL
ncbi:MAG TPA: hypothetical protein VFP26_04605 [Gemmatimonadaceae bacterium]|jgi:hypothetical protein|nr:hypothetical protein [Gemmatimonadaceae bacterium]